MKQKLFIVIFWVCSLINLSHAQDCADLKNGEIKQLDSPGASLEKFKVQDQDGLGSCYANLTSLMLQGSIEGNPEISYLQLAAISKTAGLNAQKNLINKKEDFDLYAKKNKDSDKAINGTNDGLDWDLALDGGDVCSVVNNVKEVQQKKGSGVLCRRDQTNLETIVSNGDPRRSQFKTILESSKYMNLIQGSFKGSDDQESFFNKKRIQEAKKKYNDFKNAFAGVVAEKKKQLTQIDCKNINANSLESLFQPSLQEALAFEDCFKKSTTAALSYCKVGRTLATNIEKNGDYTFESSGINPLVIQSLNSKLNSPQKKFSIQQMRKDLSDSMVIAANLNKTEIVNATSFANRLIDKISDEKLKSVVDEFLEIQQNKFSEKCVERSLVDYLSGKKFEADWSKNSILCENRDIMKQASQVIVEYEKSGLRSVDNALDFLFDKARLGYDEALMSLYALDCKDGDKIKIPENLSCRSETISLNAKASIDKNIVSTIKKNKPLGIYLCSSILYKAKKDFTQNECGLHALAVTGVKCISGKYKYLIQNSWGRESRATNPAIESVESKGAYWLDEQSFYDSASTAVNFD